MSSLPANLSVKWIEKHLTPWKRWAECKPTLRHGIPGLYLLARFEARPPANVNPLDKAIVCIGESDDLRYRLKQFHRTAFDLKEGGTHGPAKTFRRLRLAREPISSTFRCCR